jgi:hypothetical protein
MKLKIQHRPGSRKAFSNIEITGANCRNNIPNFDFDPFLRKKSNSGI